MTVETSRPYPGGRVSRRELLRLVGLGALGVYAAACSSAPTPTPTSAPAPTTAPAAAPTKPAAAPEPTKPAAAAEPAKPTVAPTTAPAAAPAAAKKPAKILVWHTMGGGTALDTFNQLLKDYSTANQGTTFELTMVPGSSEVGPYQQKITAAIAGGTPPDLLHMNFPPQFGEAGMLIQLNDYVKAVKGFDQGDYFEGAWYRNPWRDKIWGLPVMVDCRALWWNKGIFKEVGLDPEKPPTNWTELEQMAVKCNKKNAKGEFERIGYIPTYGNDHFYGWNYCNGGELLKEAGAKEVVAFNDDTGVETLTSMVKVMDAMGGQQSVSSFQQSFLTGADSPFYTGKLAMMINGVWILDELKRYGPKIEYGLAFEPVGPRGKQPYTLIGGYNWSLPKGAKNPDQAFDFLNWFSSTEQQIKWCAPQRTLPSRKSAQAAAFIKDDKDLQFFFKNLSNGKPFFAGPYRQIMWDACNVKAVQEAMFHRKAPKQALDEAATAVQAEIDKFYAQKK